jgi:hypothetical protein
LSSRHSGIATAARICLIASRRCASLSVSFSRTWITDERLFGNR